MTTDHLTTEKVSVAEAAKALGVSPATVRGYYAAGKLLGYQYPPKTRARRRDVVHLLGAFGRAACSAQGWTTSDSAGVTCPDCRGRDA